MDPRGNYFTLLYIIVLFIDIATKHLVQHTMKPHRSVPVLNNIFHITYVKYRAAFSI